MTLHNNIEEATDSMKARTHTVIDLETAGVGRDTAIYRIGCATLSPDMNINSLDIGVYALSCARFGGTFESSCQTEFWDKQLPEVQDARDKAPTYSIETALVRLNGYLVDNKVDYTWGNAPAFDQSILLRYYDECQITPHESLLYPNQMDLRTIRTLYPQVKRCIKRQFSESFLPHIAANDAVAEAIGLRYYLHRIYDWGAAWNGSEE